MASPFDQFDAPALPAGGIEAQRQADRAHIYADELALAGPDQKPLIEKEMRSNKIPGADGPAGGNPFDRFDAPPAPPPGPAPMRPELQPTLSAAMQPGFGAPRGQIPPPPQSTGYSPTAASPLMRQGAAARGNFGDPGVMSPRYPAYHKAQEQADELGVATDIATSILPVGGAIKGAVKGMSMLSKAAPDIAGLAQKAESYGIPLRPDMLGNNKVMRIVGEALEQVPLAGSKADPRQIAFNKAIMKTIGAEGEKLTPDVFAKAMDTAGKGIGDISAKNPIPLNVLGPKLKETVETLATETPEVRDIIGKYVQQMQEAAGAKGEIDGEAFRKLRTKLGGQMRRTNNGDLKHALSEIDDVMLDAIESQLSPKEIEQFTTFRRQYANGKTLEPLVAKSPTGDLSPAGLMGRVTGNASGKSAMAKGKAGDLGDLARVGQRFVKEPGSSNTAERSMAYSALGGSGLAGGWPAAGGLYAAANVYNRAGPALARRMIPRGNIPPPP